MVHAGVLWQDSITFEIACENDNITNKSIVSAYIFYDLIFDEILGLGLELFGGKGFFMSCSTLPLTFFMRFSHFF